MFWRSKVFISWQKGTIQTIAGFRLKMEDIDLLLLQNIKHNFMMIENRFTN